MKHPFEMLDAISELIYISDIQTYDLLYLNKPGREKFQIDSLEGKKCYQVLQGQKHPCDFCTNDRLSHDQVYCWEYYNSRIDGYYILQDRLLNWDGRDVRFEVAFDVTDLEHQKRALEHMVKIEDLIISCVRLLHQPEPLDTLVNKLLETIGRFLEAERAYIFELSGSRMNNTYEWCAPGVRPEKENLQDMDVRLMERWRAAFDQQECVIIHDMEDIRAVSPDEYQVLHAQNIHSLVAAPLEVDCRLIGYIGVDNPPEQNMQHIPLIFTTLSYFLTSVIERQEKERLLRELSYQDTLTGIHNRNRFMEDIEKLSLMPCKKVGIVYVDLNGLKSINDDQGHDYGDQALTNTVQKIAAVFPRESIYRIGGDEFVVICRPIKKSRFDTMVQTLKKSFLSHLDYGAATGATWSQYCEDIHQLIIRADEQMYADKKDYYRKNPLTSRYRCINDRFLELCDSATLKERIIEGAFPIYLQPKISLSDGKLAGAEALVRYVDKDKTLTLPSLFLPVLENAHLIYLVDFYVFDFVCGLLRDWMDKGISPVPISVNFSLFTLTYPDFLSELLRLWKSYDIPQHLVQIEITERDGSELSPDILITLSKMQEAGFSIVIDDFGVKYANLSLLTTTDVDVLKIDKNLLHDISSNRKTQQLTGSIIDLCKKMGITSVAEGVETEAQFEELCMLSCDIAQGYLFNQPMPLDQFIKTYGPKHKD